MTSSTPATKENSQDERPLVVFVLGLPGAGKGTQSLKISQHYGFHHISAGDCLREEQEKPGSEFGALILKCIVDGTIVPVEVTCELLRKKMKSLGWTNGRFLIDGFPRNQDNLDGWIRSSANDTNLGFCLFFDSSEAVSAERLRIRGRDSGRADDNEETMKKRFITFWEQTRPIVDYFQHQGKCHTVPGDGSVEEVWAETQKVFKKYLSTEGTKVSSTAARPAVVGQ